jgi:hypothetical protein
MIYTPELIKSTAPAVFATSPSPKMSSRYEFVPTFEMIDKFMNDGWNVTSAVQNGRGDHARHMVRLRNSELPQVGDTFPEIVLQNSHNGTSTFSVSAGLYRLVCSNGLSVPTALSESFRVRHMNFDQAEVRKITDDFVNKLPTIGKSVDRMMSKIVSEAEQVKYVQAAAEIRWDGKAPKSLRIEDILKPLRDGDKESNMWTTFNIVQEKFTRGGVSYQGPRRTTSLREIRNISKLNNVNTKLWELAESMC